MFAVDSIPAIIAISQDPFIIYTANVFAILGLRALYFALAGIVPRFIYLKYALSLFLIVVGGKMIANYFYGAKFIPDRASAPHHRSPDRWLDRPFPDPYTGCAADRTRSPADWLGPWKPGATNTQEGRPMTDSDAQTSPAGQTSNAPEESASAHTAPPRWMSRLGLAAIGWVRLLLLTTIAGLTLVATTVGILDIARAGKVTISDVLLMFIYLEIWAMIAIEATYRRLPVNFIIYIAITVLTRHLVGVAGDKATTDIGLLVDAGAILILAVAAFVIEFPVRRLYDRLKG